LSALTVLLTMFVDLAGLMISPASIRFCLSSLSVFSLAAIASPGSVNVEVVGGFEDGFGTNGTLVEGKILPGARLCVMLARGFAGEFEKEICCVVAAASLVAPVAAVSFMIDGRGAVDLLVIRTAGIAGFVGFCDVEVDLSGDLTGSLMGDFEGDNFVEEALDESDFVDPDLVGVLVVATFRFTLCLPTVV
jgi:hypothetical protein